tara:strand:+ start:1245 stop:2501 length:1257 start_codon:yes stop_codon:yes gene_type:complete
MKKVLVVAPLLTRSGYGEHARFVVDSLSKFPHLYDLYVHPLNWGVSSWDWGNDPKREYYDSLIKKSAHFQGEYDLSVQVTIPSEWKKVAKTNIGVTAGVETDRLPSQWLPISNEMDHIIVTSKHIKKLFETSPYVVKNQFSGEEVQMKGCQTPVSVVTYPVKQINPTSLKDKIVLENDFNFLTIAQLAPRKNLFATIEWFAEEFENDPVGLVIKSHVEKSNTSDRMRTEEILKGVIDRTNTPNRVCNFYHIHGTMTENELHGLYVHPQIKAIVSTTHGEGFGLPLYEAAYMGMPVICPGWSGQEDFLYAPKNPEKTNSKMTPHFEKVRYEIRDVNEDAYMPGAIEQGMKWCYPDKKHFKKGLRAIYEAYTAKKKQAESLQTYLKNTFTLENQQREIVDAIEKTSSTEWKDEMNEVEIL